MMNEQQDWLAVLARYTRAFCRKLNTSPLQQQILRSETSLYFLSVSQYYFEVQYKLQTHARKYHPSRRLSFQVKYPTKMLRGIMHLLPYHSLLAPPNLFPEDTALID
jgi:hypothetical protein